MVTANVKVASLPFLKNGVSIRATSFDWHQYPVKRPRTNQEVQWAQVGTVRHPKFDPIYRTWAGSPVFATWPPSHTPS
jgi:hypothetical protein